MFSISLTSNAEDVFESLMRSLQNVDDNAEENLRRAAVDSIAIIAHRVQQDGEGAEGTKLMTKSKERLGAYSKNYAKLREKRGRQIQQVDETNEGTLMRNFQVLSTSPTEATGGFLSNEQADIATGQEEYYGQEIFSLSKSEQDFVLEGWIPRIIDDLRV